jgi:hypothetical protein
MRRPDAVHGVSGSQYRPAALANFNDRAENDENDASKRRVVKNLG